MPRALVDRMEEFRVNEIPLKPLINFWKQCMLNEDPRAREDLFQFAETYGFPITDMGYCIAYKAVNPAKGDIILAELVTQTFLRLRRERKDVNEYIVCDTEDPSMGKARYYITGQNGAYHKRLGSLGDMFKNVVDYMEEDYFTDMHTGQMKIRLGEAVKQDRKSCDSDPRIDCSNGLHLGSKKYVDRFARSESAILACLFNPRHVVAVPQYDHSKMRVCEYYPFAIVERTKDGLQEIDTPYFELDYANYETEEMERELSRLSESGQDIPVDVEQYRKLIIDRINIIKSV
jgi:hypothetical protein